MPLAEAGLATGLLAFARLAGWAVFDPLVRQLPLALRLFLAAVLAGALAPALPATSPAGGAPGMLLGMGLEFVWGAALALSVWLVFAAVTLAITWTGHTATGGLLSLTHEQAGALEAPWRALAGWLAALAFLAASGHLLVVDALRTSFVAVPPAALPDADSFRALADAAGWLFAAGAQLALPLLALALLVQLAFGILARTTPGLDMFSAGLGVAALGLIVLWLWAVPRVTQTVGEGVAQLAAWLALLGAR